MINDMINPMSFDLTKNLHGHVRVELRDRWTGRIVDSQEKGNLITNIVQKLLLTAVWGAAGSYLTSLLPVHSKALGGLLLFDGQLTESASNTSFPSSVKLVGYAGQTSNSSDALAGSYNSAESTYTSNGFSTVWDFLTSQANGTISSLARTSDAFASNALWNEQYGRYDVGSNSSVSMTGQYVFLGYDATNQYLYLAPTQTITLNGVQYPTTNIYRAKADFSKIRLFPYMPPASQLTLVKTLTSSDGTTAAGNYTYDKYENNFAYVASSTLHLLATDGTHTTKTLTGVSGSLVAITENYYWCRYFNTLYRIQKSNVSNVTTYSISGSALVPSDNDIVFISGDDGILYPDGTIVNASGAPSIGANMRQIDDYYTYPTMSSNIFAYGRLLPSSHYLGTIANLNSPVTKTSSQTMKITYTLTEA